MQRDTIFRIASMTKAITSLGVMMLFEEGKLLLEDPVEKYIPEFKDVKVLVLNEEGSGDKPYSLVPARQPITVRHLLTHTSGLSYPFMGKKYISDLYKEADLSIGLAPTEGTIGDMVKKLARLPLYQHPGDAFEYSLGIDVLGYLIEVVSGMPLDRFFQERIFEPLGMKDTYFYLPEEKVSRLASVYAPTPDGGLKKLPEEIIRDGYTVYSSITPYSGPKTYFSGGGGLVSTAEDYYRFLLSLHPRVANPLQKRLIGPKTIELMTTGHLPELKIPFWQPGYDFGYGFQIHEDPGQSGQIGSVGEFSWGGFFHTRFWVDPKEELIAVFMSQLYPNDYLDIQEKWRVLTYQAITE